MRPRNHVVQLIALVGCLQSCSVGCDYATVTARLKAYVAHIQSNMSASSYVRFHNAEHANVSNYHEINELLESCVNASFWEEDERTLIVTKAIPIMLSLTRHFAHEADPQNVRSDLFLVQYRMKDLQSIVSQLERANSGFEDR